MPATVLLVEDERDIADLVRYHVEKAGMRFIHATDGGTALKLAHSEQPDVALLDLMLPGLDGLEVCRQLRREAATRRLPIIMLTARGEEVDRVVGLELGADDYVVKPFSAREVVARIRAVLRRTDTSAPAEDTPIEIGELRLDPARRLVTLNGDSLELSRKEYELLKLLMENAGSVVKRERVFEEVWDTQWFGSMKTLDVHVSGLRRKLGDDPSQPRFLHTVRGVGFRFASDDEL